MNPVLIDAEDGHRAPAASVRSPDFRRMVALVLPHRRFIIVGVIASVVYGALHSVGIVGVLPALKLLLSDEGFHGWVYRSAAEDRLGATLTVQFPSTAQPAAAGATIRKLHSGSPLADLGVSVGDVLLPISPAADDPVPFLKEIARAADTIQLARRSGDEETTDSPVGLPGASALTVRLRPPTAKVRLLVLAGRLVPQETSRADRVDTLAYLLAGVVIVVVLSNGARFLAVYCTSLGVLRGVMDLRRKLYSKVLRLPMDFFAQETSDIVSRFVQDVQEVQRGLLALFGSLLREPLRAVFLLVVALCLNVRLTLLMLLIGPIVVAVFWYVGRKIRKSNQRLLRSYGVMIGALGATLDAIAVVKAYNAEHAERRRLWHIDRRVLRDQLKIAWLEGTLHPVLEVLGALGIAAVTVWLGSQVLAEKTDLASFAALVLALGMLTDPLRKMADVYPRVMRSAAGARRIFPVIDALAETELREGAIELSPLADKLEFDGVTFTYPNAAGPALNNVSVTIHKGETVAIVGPNGSGKTTLARMLVRFYDPQAGRVLYDGTDVRQATLRSLRRQFSVVSQDPVVFALTVAENIAYGRRRAGREAIEAAARQAHADDFIREKPDQYDEQVGERGATLSGGQRQRLCIARAVLRDAPILIFDEATSQVDSESEHNIQQSLAEISRERTTLIIAHRLSTIRYAARVIVMDRGQVIDTGRHEELFERCRLYRTLCETQLAG